MLWYVAVLADYFDLSLDDIATANLAKRTWPSSPAARAVAC